MTTSNAQAGKETSVTNAPPPICCLPAVVDQNVASTSILPPPLSWRLQLQWTLLRVV